MKKILFFSVLSLAVYAASPTIYMAPPTESPAVKQEQKKVPLSAMEKAVAAKEVSSKGSTDMMILSPEGRAKDIKAAIDFLKQQTPTSKPTITLTNGATLSGIIDVSVMPGGTLLIFKIASLKGVKYQIEKIEHIDTIAANGP